MRQTVVNGRLGLHDPNAPENRRALVTPSSLPKTKQEAAEAITRGLLAEHGASSGELKTRQDVTEALESAGFEVVRTTKSSISIADPDGGRNIRLKGAIYEQSFNAGEGLRAEIESAAAEYRRNAESRIQRAREVCQSGTERKREENQRRHPRPRAGYERGHAVEPPERDAYGRADMADHHDGVRTAVRQPERGVVVSGSLIASNLAEIDRQNAALSKLNAKTWGVTYRRQQRTFSGAAEGDGRRQDAELDGRERAVEAERAETGEGVSADDRAGKQLLSALEQLQQDYSKRLDEGRAPSGNGGKCQGLCNGRTRR